MTAAVYALGIVVPAIVLLLVIERLRRGQLRERHAIWWLAFGLLALLGGIFPSAVARIANLVGVVMPINLVFFLAISVAFLMFLQHSAELTQLEAKTRTLAEKVALLELEVTRLRGEPGDTVGGIGEKPQG